MKFTVKLNLDNAAFTDRNRGSETARILRELATRVDDLNLTP